MEDNVIGKVSDERYEKMSANFEAKQTKLKEAGELESEAVNVDKFLSAVRRYTEIATITPAIMHEFIDRIIIHDPEQARGRRRQKVDIVYNNVGAINYQNIQDTRA